MIQWSAYPALAPAPAAADEPPAALAQLRAGLAQMQAALEEAVHAAGVLAPQIYLDTLSHSLGCLRLQSPCVW
jgi:hypothetical protein